MDGHPWTGTPRSSYASATPSTQNASCFLLVGIQSKDFKPSTVCSECTLSSALRFDFFGLPILVVARGDRLKVATDLDYDRPEKLIDRETC